MELPTHQMLQEQSPLGRLGGPRGPLSDLVPRAPLNQQKKNRESARGATGPNRPDAPWPGRAAYAAAMSPLAACGPAPRHHFGSLKRSMGCPQALRMLVQASFM